MPNLIGHGMFLVLLYLKVIYNTSKLLRHLCFGALICICVLDVRDGEMELR